MPAPTVRDFQSQKFETAGYAPSSATSVALSSVLVVQILLSNTDTVDRLVTLKDGSDNVMYNYTVAAGDLIAIEIPQAWKFSNGVKINAAAANVVRYELLGFYAKS